MSSNSSLARHLSVALLALTTLASGRAAAQAPAAPLAPAGDVDVSGSSTFVVLLRGARVGSETVSITRSGVGWLIAGSGRLLPPFDLVTNKFEATYGADWQPRQLALQGSLRGQGLSVSTTFGVTTAMNDVVQAGKRGSVSHQISARAVVIPGNFFGAYEALAIRLNGATAGSRVPVYMAPEGETNATVNRVTARRVSIGDRVLDLRDFSITFNTPSGPVPVDLWIDERHRLARLVLPAASLVVIREDLATVMAREERVRNAGDEDVFIPANGFTLGGTLTRPPAGMVSPKMPAVVLAAGPGPQDRDFTSFGVSIFGQLAGALADAGYLVIRYDGRGIGRSGGRTENASLTEYADDVVQVISWLRKRRDVDGDRLAVVGYSEAGPIAMLAAGREKRIKAVVLAGAPGLSGRDVTLERQRQALAQLTIPEAEKAARTALQARIIDATISGQGWDTIPPDVRTQAESPWFKSWLLFDPIAAMKRLNQPVLALHGSLDTEVPPAHADRLEALARERKGDAGLQSSRIIVSGVNHLFAPATIGSMDEYDSLTDRAISPEVGKAIVTWLGQVLVRR